MYPYSFLLVICVFISLAGCAAFNAGPAEFNETNKNGIVIISAYGNRNFSLSLDRLNKRTNKLLTSSANGSTFFRYNKGEGNQYQIIKMKPGDYVFKSLHYSKEEGNKKEKYVLCLNDATYRFTVEPGKIIYLGELELQFPSKLIYTEGSLNTANYTLKSHPKIKGKATKAKLSSAAFENGLDLFGNQATCGGI